MQTTSRQDPTNGSEELDRETQRERTSRVLIDLNSEERVMVGCQGTACVPGEQGTRVNGGENDENTSLDSRDRDIQSQEVTGTATDQALRRDSRRGVVNGVLYTAGEQQDLDSVENVNGRPNGTDEANSREIGDDVSTETNPAVTWLASRSPSQGSQPGACQCQRLPPGRVGSALPCRACKSPCLSLACRLPQAPPTLPDRREPLSHL
ncbi:uncharacterized protein LOC121585711 [Coregonus clupeaformis]|uniref:uncharacterized protein LOC121585711 n=1 Tax=Coregonus clupeaformis TaxID=59861 RepID=UPI001E1C4FC7|nr:uncharacterized protein LOC121585711 [Coregonus clupeaformis]